MNNLVWPWLAFRTASVSRRRPGRKRSWPMRSSGPLGMSRMPVASTTMAPGLPRAKRSYQATTSSVTKPSFGGAPGHHGGNPGALLKEERADGDRREQPRRRRLLARRRSPGLRLIADALRRSPHSYGLPRSEKPDNGQRSRTIAVGKHADANRTFFIVRSGKCISRALAKRQSNSDLAIAAFVPIEFSKKMRSSFPAKACYDYRAISLKSFPSKESIARDLRVLR